MTIFNSIGSYGYASVQVHQRLSLAATVTKFILERRRCQGVWGNASGISPSKYQKKCCCPSPCFRLPYLFCFRLARLLLLLAFFFVCSPLSGSYSLLCHHFLPLAACNVFSDALPLLQAGSADLYTAYIPAYLPTYPYLTLPYLTLPYLTLPTLPTYLRTIITLHYIIYITLHYITLHWIALRYHMGQHIPLHFITKHFITLRYITSHYIT